MSISLGDKFELPNGKVAHITEVFSLGFNYHTLNKDGDCIKGQQYKLKKDHYEENHS